MAMQLDAGDVGRKEVFLIDPVNIITEIDQNGREVEHSDEAVGEMVNSLLKYGQLQPVVARKVQGKKVQLVLGYRRAKAAKKINEDKLTPEPFRLLVRMMDLNEEESFERNVAENMHRSDLTPIDHAHNQRIFREKFGWDEKRIADFYNMSLGYVSQLRKVHQLPTEVQQEVKEGKMAASAEGATKQRKARSAASSTARPSTRSTRGTARMTG